jgi:hypothetical protein
VSKPIVGAIRAEKPIKPTASTTNSNMNAIPRYQENPRNLMLPGIAACTAANPRLVSRTIHGIGPLSQFRSVDMNSSKLPATLALRAAIGRAHSGRYVRSMEYEVFRYSSRASGLRKARNACCAVGVFGSNLDCGTSSLVKCRTCSQRLETRGCSPCTSSPR